MAYVDNLATAQHAIFRGRVRMAAVITAVNVSNEAPTDDTQRDTLRGNLATNVLNNPDLYEERFVWGVLTNAVVASNGINAPDNDIEYVVTQIWDAIAGV